MRTQQEVRVAKMQAASQRRLAHERGALCLATVAQSSFLAYGFLASHRASLARTRVRIVAAEAESRFREYFEEHPLAMMIYDATSLRVLTANAAAQRQYGYSRERFLGLSFCDLRPESDVAEFRSDLETYLLASPRSGSAGCAVTCARTAPSSTLMYRSISSRMRATKHASSPRSKSRTRSGET